MSLTDLTNYDFEFLHVIGLDHVDKKQKKRIWKCQCKCGNIVYVPTGYLTSGHTKSCGCIKADYIHHIKKYCSSRSKVNGVSFAKREGKYITRCVRNNKEYHLGYFDELKDAQIMSIMANSFTSYETFSEWFPVKKETLRYLKELCEKEKVDAFDIADSILDMVFAGIYLEEVYLNMNKMQEYVKTFAEAYNEKL